MGLSHNKLTVVIHPGRQVVYLPTHLEHSTCNLDPLVLGAGISRTWIGRLTIDQESLQHMSPIVEHLKDRWNWWGCLQSSKKGGNWVESRGWRARETISQHLSLHLLSGMLSTPACNFLSGCKASWSEQDDILMDHRNQRNQKMKWTKDF